MNGGFKYVIVKFGNFECKVNIIFNMFKSLIYKKMLIVYDYLIKLNGKFISDLNVFRLYDIIVEKCL